MAKKLLSTKRWLLTLVGAAMTMAAMAAEPIATFEKTADSWQLKDVTISFADGEHSCVKLAAANLQKDFEQVTGEKPAISETAPKILIGTVGTNKQIDLWVKQGDHVDSFEGANNAIGTLVLKFQTAEELEYAINHQREWLTVVVK